MLIMLMLGGEFELAMSQKISQMIELYLKKNRIKQCYVISTLPDQELEVGRLKSDERLLPNHLREKLVHMTYSVGLNE